MIGRVPRMLCRTSGGKYCLRRRCLPVGGWLMGRPLLAINAYDDPLIDGRK